MLKNICITINYHWFVLQFRETKTKDTKMIRLLFQIEIQKTVHIVVFVGQYNICLPSYSSTQYHKQAKTNKVFWKHQYNTFLMETLKRPEMILSVSLVFHGNSRDEYSQKCPQIFNLEFPGNLAGIPDNFFFILKFKSVFTYLLYKKLDHKAKFTKYFVTGKNFFYEKKIVKKTSNSVASKCVPN